jgi:hypothetical protein
MKFKEYLNKKLDNDENLELDIRVWYLLKFNLTPSDQKYIETPFEWMEFMYRRYMTRPGYDLKRDYIASKLYEENKDEMIDKAYDEKFGEELTSQLDDTGYTEEEKANIFKAFKESYKEGL